MLYANKARKRNNTLLSRRDLVSSRPHLLGDQEKADFGPFRVKFDPVTKI